MTTAIDIIL